MKARRLKASLGDKGLLVILFAGVAALAAMSWIYYGTQHNTPLSGVFAFLASMLACMLFIQWWVSRIGCRRNTSDRLFETFQDVYFRTDSEGAVAEISPSVTGLFGYRPDEVIGNLVSTFWSADHYDEVKKVFDTIMQGGLIRNEEIVLMHKDGYPIFVSLSAQSMSDGGSEGLMRDMTERKRVDMPLAEANDELQSLFDNMRDVVYRADAEDYIRFVTPSVETMFGYRPDEVLGKPGQGFWHPQWDNGDRVVQHLVEQGYVEDEEGVMLHRDGHEIYCSVSARRLPDGSIEGVFRDIGARKRAEASMLRAKEEAEAANADKSRFLAAASHDLRQPLHALNLYLDAALCETDEAVRKGLLERVRVASHDLGELLGVLLDISRLDAQTMPPECTAMALGPLMNGLVAEFRPQAEAKGIALRTRGCDRAAVRSDPVLLGRILRNLLSNAVRYTERGGVLLACRRVGGILRIGVWDTGLGIAEDEQDRVFMEFYQLHNPERDREKGLGLGLSIVQRLSALLGHPVRVRSRPGRGSCFSIDLPLCGEIEEDHDEGTPQGVTTKLSGRFVLVVDDDVAILDAMRLWLRRWGCEGLLVESGAALLGELSRYAYPVPDAIIVDYRLRDHCTGLDVVRDARAHFGTEIPAIVISGDTGIAGVIAQAGCRYLAKPAQERDILAMLAESVFVAPKPSPGQASRVP